MSSILADFCNTELTIVPKLLKGILGANFNNALCNGITWSFLLWIILYWCYDQIIKALFKYQKFPQFLRIRLNGSIWNVGMHTYYLVLFYLHIAKKYPDNGWRELKFFEQQQHSVSFLESMTFACFCSCLLVNGCIQGVQRSYLCLVKFAALTIACSAAYILGFVDLSFTLVALSALTGMFDDFTRLLFCWLCKTSTTRTLLINSMFASSLMVFCTVYFYVVPIECLNPLGSMRLPGDADLIRLALFISLLCWINLVIYNSLLLNLIFHQLYHVKKSRKEYVEIVTLYSDTGKQFQSMALLCLGSCIECSLFPPRSDDGILMELLRLEEKRRKRQVNVRRRPKKKSIIIRLVKYLWALKRKIRLKVREVLWDDSSEDSESDSDSTLDCDSDESFISSDDQGHSQIEAFRSYSEADTLPLVDKQEDIAAAEAEVVNDPLDRSVNQESAEDRRDSVFG